MFKTDFESWMTETGRGWKSTRSYSGALGRKLSVMARALGLTSQNLLAFDDLEAYRAVSKALMAHPDFIEFDTIGNRMYSAALNRYADFLEQRVPAADIEIEALIGDDTLDSTTRRALIDARLGQGRFRRRVVSYWGECAVSRSRSVELLIASHICPWRHASNEDRLNPFNGLLLKPDLDILFDQGYVTFDRKGKIVISRAHLDMVVEFGASEDMCLNRCEEPHRPFLAYHHDNVFLG